jgi:pyruvate dehydrogenase E1 component beta subunit
MAEGFGENAAVARVGAPRVPIGYAPSIEDAARVTEELIVATVRGMAPSPKRRTRRA